MNKILNKFGYILFSKELFDALYQRKNEFNPLNQLLYKHLHKDFFYIQIGANDGVYHDPIYHFVTKNNVQGIALEPLPHIFKKLEKNYSGYKNVTLLNKAIHKNKKKASIFYVNQDLRKYPEWTKGTASFFKEHHELSNIEEQDIIEEEIECISWKELIEAYKIKCIDLLLIDTEGYDSEIIKLIDFEKLKPSIIYFEHGMKQGIMSYTEFCDTQHILLKHEYSIIVLDNDVIAYTK